ncbi:MAG: GNAT family N-acetyltransferase [Anaerolineae bacterium]|nr:GNAT family N-acetyltransferase [Anaerolineae bacterium]
MTQKLLEPLPWDSEFFGLAIARITATRLDGAGIKELMEQAQAAKLRCLYFEADPNDPATVAAVEQYGFHLVDVRVVLEHPFDDRPAPVPRYPVPEELVIGSYRPDEMPRLQDISAQIGLTSRFDFDKQFAPGQSERLYRVWIENACHGFADAVLVARWHQDGEAVGLITCTWRDAIAHIQLAGVHAHYRQRGVGTGLVQGALDWARSQQARRMQVVTQARNVPAQRLYQQMGFFTRSMTLFYHKWLFS